MNNAEQGSQLELWTKGQDSPPARFDLLSDGTDSQGLLFQPSESPAATPGAAFAQDRPLNILVADDNEVNRRIIQAILMKLGYSCAEASDGEEALQQFNSGSYDYIFMDLDMPELTGVEAARAIRDLEKARSSGGAPKRRCEIIAVTANVSSEMRLDCKLAGMNGFLEKPITVDIVKDQLLRSWSRIQARRSRSEKNA